MHRVILLACTFGLLLAPSVSGQKAKPNFAGTWVPVSGGPDDAETITQDATTLTMAHPSEGGAHTMRYRLDGSETRSSIAGMVMISKASWDGDKLVLTYHRVDNTSETKQVLSFEPSGRLVVEYSAPGASGKIDSGKLIYRKAPQKS